MTATRLGLDPLIGSQNVFVTFYLAVVFSTWYGGATAATVAAILSAAASSYWFQPPVGDFSTAPNQLISTGVFLGVCAAIIAFSESERRAKEEATVLADEARRNERALRMQARVLDSMVEGVSLSTEEGVIVYTNHAEDSMFGYEAGELIGQHVTVQNTYSSEENAKIVGEVFDQLRTVGYWSGEFSNRRKDGSPFITFARISLLEIEGQRYFLCVQEDVTEQRRADLALRESQKQFETAVYAGKVGVWVWDVEKNHVSWNEHLYEFHGMEPGSFSGKVEDFAKLIHPEDADRMTTAIGRALEHDAPFSQEFRALRPDGEIRWLSTNGSVLRDTQGNPIRMVGATIDTTSRKHLEFELERRVDERTAELVAANRELEGFTYSVSHDLRAPLRSIIGTSMILLEDYGDELREDAKRELKRQAAAAKRLADLIDDLLQFSRLGRAEIARREFDLSAVAHEIVGDAVRRHGVEATINIQPGLQASGDETLLRMVIENLVDNALKYRKADEPPSIEIGQDAGAYYVRDRGIGFESAYADKVFQPFERLHRATEYPGTGIGLANVKRIVERHGGRVWVEAKPKEGATFYFILG
jgi:PAS domain S-box-containing protein